MSTQVFVFDRYLQYCFFLLASTSSTIIATINITITRALFDLFAKDIFPGTGCKITEHLLRTNV